MRTIKIIMNVAFILTCYKTSYTSAPHRESMEANAENETAQKVQQCRQHINLNLLTDAMLAGTVAKLLVTRKCDFETYFECGASMAANKANFGLLSKIIPTLTPEQMKMVEEDKKANKWRISKNALNWAPGVCIAVGAPPVVTCCTTAVSCASTIPEARQKIYDAEDTCVAEVKKIFSR